MTIAILAQLLDEKDQNVGACIVCNDSLHVISLGHCKASIHAELNALLNAKLSRGVDLKKCSLYTTDPPCLPCTVAVLKAGVRVVVYGDRDKQGLRKDVHHLVYREKACFKRYECYIRINDDEKKFAIDLCNSTISFKKVEKSLVADEVEEPKPQTSTGREIPYCTDYFMAMAFLSATRSKDRKHYIGGCLVSPYPHHVVSLGYNTVPDGRDFTDDNVDWSPPYQKKYSRPQ
jgi:deoxycytidylate deaminase